MRIRSKMQKCITGLAAMTLAFGMIAGGVTEGTQVQAADTAKETLYVVNQEFTSVGSMTKNTEYVFILANNGTGAYTTGQAIAGIPTGSAVLRYRGTSRPSDWSTGSDPDSSKTDGYVDVINKGSGFDSCMGGGIRYTGNGWQYACNAGGVKYNATGPFRVYSFTSYDYTADNVSASLNINDPSVQNKINRGEFTITNSELTMKVTVGGKTYTVPEYTVDPSDSTMNLLNGDNTVKVKVGTNITKTITLTQEPTPNAQRVNSGECTLENLVPGAGYTVILPDGSSVNVTADASGKIDVSAFAGKTIKLAKQGVDANGTVISPAQTITLPAREIVSGLNIDTTNGQINGLTANATYTFTVPNADGTEEETITVTADANGQINAYPYAGKKLQIVKNAVNGSFDSLPYDLQVPARYDAPDTGVDTESGKLTSLTPGAAYEIHYDTETVTEVADAAGQIDAARYAGKEITIKKMGDGNYMTSETHTMTIAEKYKAPEAQAENKDGKLSGLEPGGTYQITVKDEDGNPTETRDVIASADGTIDIQDYAGRDIEVRRKGDENTQVSDPIAVTVPKREAVPETKMNREGSLEGLTPGNTYWIYVDDQKIEITPKDGEVIDVSQFAGKTITIRQAGSDDRLPSAPQQITIPERGATPSGTAYKTGTVKGLEPNTTYKIYVDQKWEEMTTDENGTLSLEGHEGSTIQIIRLGDDKHTVSLPQIITIPKRGAPVCEGETREEEPKYDSKLNNNSASLIETVFTKEEQEAIKKGVDGRVYLEIKAESVEVPETDREKIEAVLDTYKVAGYIDISCYKQLIRDGVAETPVKVTVTNGDTLSVTIKIPQEFLNKDPNILREYRIVRYHEGEAYAEILPTDYNRADGTLTFETDKFSTYAIVYADTQVPQTVTTKTPQTGDQMPVYAVAVLAVLSAAGAGILKKTRR